MSATPSQCGHRRSVGGPGAVDREAQPLPHRSCQDKSGAMTFKKAGNISQELFKKICTDGRLRYHIQSHVPKIEGAGTQVSPPESTRNPLQCARPSKGGGGGGRGGDENPLGERTRVTV